MRPQRTPGPRGPASRASLLVLASLLVACSHAPGGGLSLVSREAASAALRLRVSLPPEPPAGRRLQAALPQSWTSATVTLRSATALVEPRVFTIAKPGALGSYADGTTYADLVVPVGALRPASDYALDVRLLDGTALRGAASLRQQTFNTGSNVVTVPLYGLSTYAVGSYPHVVKTSARGEVWVANYGGGSVSRLRSDGSPIATYPFAGYGAWGVAVDASDNAWVSLMSTTTSNGSVRRIKASDGSITTFALTVNPTGIGIGGSKAWVACAGNVIRRFDTGTLTNEAQFALPAGSNPHDVEVDPSGTVFVANRDLGSISKLTAAGAASGAPFPLAVEAQPRGMARDPVSGDYWVAQESGSAVSRYTAAGALVGTYRLPSQVRWLACDASGNVWATLTDLNEVVQLSSAGVELQRLPVGAAPSGIDVDPSGNVWVTNFNDGTVTKIRPRIPYGVTLDGVDDSVANTDGFMTPVIASNFTYEFWAKPAATHEIDPETNNSGTHGTSGQRYVLFPGIVGTNAGAGVSMGTNGISVYEHASGYIPGILVHPGSFTDWTHVAVVYTANRPTLYVNGQLARTGLQSTKTVSPSIYYGGYRDGTLDGAYGAFQGSVGELRIWSVARSQAQLQANMRATLAGNEAGLVGLWQFNEGAGTTVRDETGGGRTLTVSKGPNGTGATWTERSF